MTWHYKIVVKEEEHFGEKIKQYRVAEYYPALECWTVEPVRVAEESVEDLIWSLEKMLEAAKKAYYHPELVLDEDEWELRKRLEQAENGEFASQEEVDELRLKWTKEDVAFMQELVDDPPEPNEDLVAAYKAYNTSKNDDGSFNFNVEEK